MGSGGPDDSTPLGLIVVGGFGWGRHVAGFLSLVRGGGAAPPASRRLSAGPRPDRSGERRRRRGMRTGERRGPLHWCRHRQ
ncbi:Os04g0119601 [Oryza sativa Japonica Group]|uniref:Os04g0119601 protein n=1 Tax=Oryza sativa subsp. japonica TaxID=39947 RepID=A0A0P0W690_ORYSJ|nr:Os04g0119601 [Oryza sativa Japonica Group]